MRNITLLNVKPIFLMLIAGLSLSLPVGCSFFEPHKIVISQGSWIDENKVDQLEIGMSQDQVLYLLGTPLLQDVFAPDNWVYAYRESIGTEKLRERRLQFDFNDNALASIEKQFPQPISRQRPAASKKSKPKAARPEKPAPAESN